eukprot:1598689-Pleurochrysis_carterae.AAC.1
MTWPQAKWRAQFAGRNPTTARKAWHAVFAFELKAAPKKRKMLPRNAKRPQETRNAPKKRKMLPRNAKCSRRCNKQHASGRKQSRATCFWTQANIWR